jgi:hypothetical protein
MTVGRNRAGHTSERSRGPNLAIFRFMKLCIFVGVNVGGYAGWELGEPLGMTWAFVISSVCSIIGVYLGWKVARTYLE